MAQRHLDLLQRRFAFVGELGERPAQVMRSHVYTDLLGVQLHYIKDSLCSHAGALDMATAAS